jgi:hypothetical protein
MPDGSHCDYNAQITFQLLPQVIGRRKVLCFSALASIGSVA